MLLALRCLSILIHWPHNCRLIRKSLGIEFPRFFMKLIPSISKAFDQVFLNYMEQLNNIQQETNSPNTTNQIEILSNTSSFFIESLILCSQFLLKCNLHLEHDFDSLLPEQPWNEADLQLLRFRIQSPLDIQNVSTNLHQFNHHCVSLFSQNYKSSSKFNELDKATKMAFTGDFQECGLASQIYHVVEFANTLLLSFSKLPNDISDKNLQLTSKLYLQCQVLNTEVLFLLLCSLRSYSTSTNGTSQSSKSNSILLDMMKNSTRYQKLVGKLFEQRIPKWLWKQIEFGDIIFRVMLRRGLIMIRIDNTIRRFIEVEDINSQQQEDMKIVTSSSKSVKIEDGTIQSSGSKMKELLLSNEMKTDFFFWAALTFNQLRLANQTIQKSVVNASDSNEFGILIDYIEKFHTNDSQLCYDLWPWGVKPPSLSSSQEEEGVVAVTEQDEEQIIQLGNTNSYHILKQSSSTKKDIADSCVGYIAWDCILAELLDSKVVSLSHNSQQPPSYLQPQLVGNPNVVTPFLDKISSIQIDYFFQMIQIVFVVIHSQYSTLGQDSQLIIPLPLCQLKILEYISTLLSLERVHCFKLLSRYGILEMLLSDCFITGNAKYSNKMSHDNYYQIQNEDKSSDSLKTKYFSNSKELYGDVALLWIALHDRICDFIRVEISYALIEMKPSQYNAVNSSIPIYFDLTNSEAVIIRLMNFISVSNTSQSLCPSHTAYQIIRLLHNLVKMFMSSDSKKIYEMNNKLLVKLLFLLEIQFKSLGIERLEPSTIPLKRLRSFSQALDNPFDWPSITANLALILQLSIQSNQHHWTTIFLNDFIPSSGDRTDVVPNQTQSAINRKDSLVPDHQPSVAKMSTSRTTVDKEATPTTDTTTLRPHSTHKVRSLLLLLLEPYTRVAGLQLLTKLLVYCCVEYHHIVRMLKGESSNQNNSNDNLDVNDEVVDVSKKRLQQKKQLLRSLAIEILCGLLDFVSFSAKYPPHCEGLPTGLECMSILTFLLRSPNYFTIRSTLQEFFQQSDSISHLIFALMKCVGNTMNFSANGKLSQEFNEVDVGIPLTAQSAGSVILRQGLSLLTAIMADNEECKFQFEQIMRNARRKQEVASYTIGHTPVKSTTRSGATAVARKSTQPTGYTSTNPHGIKPFSSMQSSRTASNTQSVLNTKKIDDIRSLMLKAEPIPTRITIIVLFELLLDGFCWSSKDAIEISHSDEPLFSLDEDRPKIRNTTIIEDLFGIVPFCNVNEQKFIINSIRNLVSGRASLVNLNACANSKPSVLHLALNLFNSIPEQIHDYNVELIQCLGRHGISVAQLKHLFRLLQSKHDCRPAYASKLIQALQGMIIDQNGPKQTFVFEGTNSGLKLPSISKWPAQKAFSFSLWFRAEAPKANISRYSSNMSEARLREQSYTSKDADKLAGNVYSPYLLCMRSNLGSGLEVYLKPFGSKERDGSNNSIDFSNKTTFRIVVRYHSENGETSTISPDHKGLIVFEGRWHFLALSFASGNMFTKSEFCIQMDDHFLKQDFVFPRLQEVIAQPYIGDCPTTLQKNGLYTTMRGQIGAIYFFADALSEGQMRSIHALGPDYIYNFEPWSDSVYRDWNASSGAIAMRLKKTVNPVFSILDGSLTGTILLAYNPAVWKGDYFLDNTPGSNQSKWKNQSSTTKSSSAASIHSGRRRGQSEDLTFPINSETDHIVPRNLNRMAAYKLPGTYRSTTQDAKLALNSLGGIKIIIPMFTLLDQAKYVTKLKYPPSPANNCTIHPSLVTYQELPSSTSASEGSSSKQFSTITTSNSVSQNLNEYPVEHSFNSEKLTNTDPDNSYTIIKSNRTSPSQSVDLSSEPYQNYEKNMEHDETIFPSILDLLCTLLRNHRDNQDTLYHSFGCHVISYLLEKVSPKHFTTSILEKLIEMYFSCQLVPALQVALLDQVLCNFKLWVYSPFSTQVRLLNWLCEQVSTSSTLNCDALSFQRIVDSLYLLYDYDSNSLEDEINEKAVAGPPELGTKDDIEIQHENRIRTASTSSISSVSQSGFDDNSSASTKLHSQGLTNFLRSARRVFNANNTVQVMHEVNRLKHKELQQIRSRLFSLLNIIIDASKALLPDQVIMLISMLHQTATAISKVEIISFLLNLLNSKRLSSSFLIALSGDGCFHSICDLFSNSNCNVRLYLLVFIGRIFERCNDLCKEGSSNYGVKNIKQAKSSRFYNQIFSDLEGYDKDQVDDHLILDSEDTSKPGQDHSLLSFKLNHIKFFTQTLQNSMENTKSPGENRPQDAKLSISQYLLHSHSMVPILLTVQQMLVNEFLKYSDHIQEDPSNYADKMLIQCLESDYLKLLSLRQSLIITGIFQQLLFGGSVISVLPCVIDLQEDLKSKRFQTTNDYHAKDVANINRTRSFESFSLSLTRFSGQLDVDTSSHQMDEEAPPNEFQLLSNKITLEMESVLPVDPNELIIRCPHIILPLMVLLSHGTIDVNARLWFLRNLLLCCTSSSTNRESILRLPHWTSYFFTLFLSEISHYRTIQTYRESDSFSTETLLHIDLLLSKSDQVIQNCFKFLRIMIRYSQQYGYPSCDAAYPLMVTNLESVGSRSFNFSEVEVVQEICKGDRLQGISAIRYLLGSLRSFQELNKPDNSEDFQLLVMMCLLSPQSNTLIEKKEKSDEKTESDVISSNGSTELNPISLNQSSMIKDIRAKIDHVDKWLLACSMLEWMDSLESILSSKTSELVYKKSGTIKNERHTPEKHSSVQSEAWVIINEDQSNKINMSCTLPVLTIIGRLADDWFKEWDELSKRNPIWLFSEKSFRIRSVTAIADDITLTSSIHTPNPLKQQKSIMVGSEGKYHRYTNNIPITSGTNTQSSQKMRSNTIAIKKPQSNRAVQPEKSSLLDVNGGFSWVLIRISTSFIYQSMKTLSVQKASTVSIPAMSEVLVTATRTMSETSNNDIFLAISKTVTNLQSILTSCRARKTDFIALEELYTLASLCQSLHVSVIVNTTTIHDMWIGQLCRSDVSDGQPSVSHQALLDVLQLIVLLIQSNQAILRSLIANAVQTIKNRTESVGSPVIEPFQSAVQVPIEEEMESRYSTIRLSFLEPHTQPLDLFRDENYLVSDRLEVAVSLADSQVDSNLMMNMAYSVEAEPVMSYATSFDSPRELDTLRNLPTSSIAEKIIDRIVDAIHPNGSKDSGDGKHIQVDLSNHDDVASLFYSSICFELYGELGFATLEDSFKIKFKSIDLHEIWYAIIQKVCTDSRKIQTEWIDTKLQELQLTISTPLANAESMALPYTYQDYNKSTTLEMERMHRSVNNWYNLCWNMRTNFEEQNGLRLKESIRQSEVVTQRRNENRWIRLFSESANERGPWGYTLAISDNGRAIFWTLDSNETNLKLRLRLKRNPLGSKHLMATRLAVGNSTRIKSVQSNENDSQPTTSVESHGKDLMMYKKFSKAKDESSPMKEDLSSKQLSTQDIAKALELDDENYSDDENEIDQDGIGGQPHHMTETLTVYSDATERILCALDVEIIIPATNSSGGKTLGKLEIYRSKFTFSRRNENDLYDFVNKSGNTEFLWACQCYPSNTWSTDELLHVYRRNFQQRYVAVEIFFTSRTSLFVNAFNPIMAKKLYKTLSKHTKAPNLLQLFTGRPKLAILKPILSGITVTEAWIQRRITNFEYIIHLNLIAGRTFNDLSQYPVFPWVLKDYTSHQLDLRNPDNFRNFKWPMGAQVESQRKMMMEKYIACESMRDEEFNPYHNGSHYSTSAVVIWYLLRMEPFTSFHVWLQEGKFDKADRLFYSIGSAYQSCTMNSMDVKELIPEFFCNPEFLENMNDIYFGTKQTGQVIGDVELPNWAANAHDFVRIHRDALESETVSSNLHHWIDLIFGYKQRPPFLGGSAASVEACNVFVHLTYSNAIDLERIALEDPELYDQIVRQIDNFGQTPEQLFDKPHPSRSSPDKVDQYLLIWPIASILRGADTLPKSSPPLEKPLKILNYGDIQVSSRSILLISDSSTFERLVTVDSYRYISFHIFQVRQPDIVPPFSIKLDKTAVKAAILNGTKISNETSTTANPLSEMSNLSMSSYLMSSQPKGKIAGIPFASQLQSQHHYSKGTLSEIEFDINLIGNIRNVENYLEEEAVVEQISSGMKLTHRMVNSKSGVSETVGSSTRSSPPRMVRSQTTVKGDKVEVPLDPSMKSDVDSSSKSSKTGSPPSSLKSSKKPAATISSKGVVNIKAVFTTATHEYTLKSDRSRPPAPNAIMRSHSTIQHFQERVDENISCNLFAVLPDTKLLFSCGHWDNTFKVTSLDTGKLIQSISYHRDLVTCVAIASDFGRHWLITGSKDCVVTVWKIFPERERESSLNGVGSTNVPGHPIGLGGGVNAIELVDTTPSHLLYGHDDSVNCVAVNAELDLIVSGSDDGTIILHTLREGIYLRSLFLHKDISQLFLSQAKYQNERQMTTRDRSITPTKESKKNETDDGNLKDTAAVPLQSCENESENSVSKVQCRVHLVTICHNTGYIVAFSSDGNLLSTFSMNGRFLHAIHTRERIYCLCSSEDGNVVLTGGDRCLVVLRWAWNLSLANNGPRKGLDCVVDGSNLQLNLPPITSPIRSMVLTKQERHLIVGLQSGHIRILAQDSQYLRMKLQKKLQEIGILNEGF